MGRLALVEAGTRHDPNLRSLEAFASKGVRGAMIDYARGRAYDVDRTAAGMYAADSNDDGDDEAHEEQLRRSMLGEVGLAVAENLHYLRRQAASLLIAKLYAERDTGTEDDVLERRDRDDQLAFVREILQGLPARQKEVVRLFYEEEVPLGEIGARLGVGRKTAWRDHDAVKAAVAKVVARRGR
ncbi:MAG: sigma-70 family RNA polymerase sigma factor [Polyangiaceae bacterium]